MPDYKDDKKEISKSSADNKQNKLNCHQQYKRAIKLLDNANDNPKKLKEVTYLLYQSWVNGSKKARLYFTDKKNMAVVKDIKVSTPNAMLPKESFRWGLCYLVGIIVPQDDEKAYQYIRASAEGDDVDGLNFLGWMLHNGRGCDIDEKNAFSWYKKAADKEFRIAQRNVAYMLLKGIGCVKNEKEAMSWFRKAAEQGDMLGQGFLGWMFYKGTGCAKDKKAAVRWCRKAMAQGDATAALDLRHILPNEKPRFLAIAARLYEKRDEQKERKKAQEELNNEPESSLRDLLLHLLQDSFPREDIRQLLIKTYQNNSKDATDSHQIVVQLLAEADNSYEGICNDENNKKLQELILELVQSGELSDNTLLSKVHALRLLFRYMLQRLVHGSRFNNFQFDLSCFNIFDFRMFKFEQDYVIFNQVFCSLLSRYNSQSLGSIEGTQNQNNTNHGLSADAKKSESLSDIGRILYQILAISKDSLPSYLDKSNKELLWAVMNTRRSGDKKEDKSILFSYSEKKLSSALVLFATDDDPLSEYLTSKSQATKLKLINMERTLKASFGRTKKNLREIHHDIETRYHCVFNGQDIVTTTNQQVRRTKTEADIHKQLSIVFNVMSSNDAKHKALLEINRLVKKAIGIRRNDNYLVHVLYRSRSSTAIYEQLYILRDSIQALADSFNQRSDFQKSTSCIKRTAEIQDIKAERNAVSLNETIESPSLSRQSF